MIPPAPYTSARAALPEPPSDTPVLSDNARLFTITLSASAGLLSFASIVESRITALELPVACTAEPPRWPLMVTFIAEKDDSSCSSTKLRCGATTPEPSADGDTDDDTATVLALSFPFPLTLESSRTNEVPLPLACTPLSQWFSATTTACIAAPSPDIARKFSKCRCACSMNAAA